MGVSEERFWTLNPRTIKPYVKAYELRAKNKDMEMWQMGIYVHRAVGVVVGDVLASFAKKKNTEKYFDKPLSKMAEEKQEQEKPLTQEEITERTEKLFDMLCGMQQKFEMNKKLQR